MRNNGSAAGELRVGNGTLLCTFSECKVRDGAPDGAREKIDKISN